MTGPLTNALSNIDFQGIIDSLKESGWLQYFFPFLLVYAITYVVLDKIKLFEGKEKKPVRVIISLVFAITSIAFDVTEGHTLGDLLYSLFPGVSALSVAILGLYIIMAMFDVDPMKFTGNENTDKIIKITLGVIGIIWLIYYFGLGLGYWDNVSWQDNFVIRLLEDPTLWILVVMYFTFKWISSDDTSSEKKEKDTE